MALGKHLLLFLLLLYCKIVFTLSGPTGWDGYTCRNS